MPGSGKQPPEIQEQIKELLEAGFDPTTIHRRLKVGRSSIYRMKRCLQQHGTNYMPTEMNKKNGRPKVLTPDQELEVKEWLRDQKNRARYLDDLVWLIHDRFGIVCSTTTMSKMKRKWLRVIQYEEEGTPIDDLTRSQLMETHPDLPLLHEAQVPQAQMSAPVHPAPEAQGASTNASQQPTTDQQQAPSQPQAVPGSQQLSQQQQQQFTPPSSQTFLQSPTMQMQQQTPSGSQQMSPSQQAFMQSPTMQMQAQMMAGAQFDPQLGFHGDFTADMSPQHLTA